MNTKRSSNSPFVFDTTDAFKRATKLYETVQTLTQSAALRAYRQRLVGAAVRAAVCLAEALEATSPVIERRRNEEARVALTRMAAVVKLLSTTGEISSEVYAHVRHLVDALATSTRCDHKETKPAAPTVDNDASFDGDTEEHSTIPATKVPPIIEQPPEATARTTSDGDSDELSVRKRDPVDESN